MHSTQLGRLAFALADHPRFTRIKRIFPVAVWKFGCYLVGVEQQQGHQHEHQPPPALFPLFYPKLTSSLPSNDVAFFCI